MSETNRVIAQLAEQNIIVNKTPKPSGYPFEFKRSEDEFVDCLLTFMAKYGYRKQDDDWFPGDPGETGENEYFIMNDDVEFCISFDDKILSHLV